MSDGWNYSIVLLCQAADQADSNVIGEALGYGPDTFSLPAGVEGGPVSHYFNHSFAPDEFIEKVTAMGQGQPPEGMPQELLPALNRMVISIRDGGDPLDHVSDVLSDYGLMRL